VGMIYLDTLLGTSKDTHVLSSRLSQYKYTGECWEPQRRDSLTEIFLTSH
jgi:hypothetical protein